MSILDIRSKSNKTIIVYLAVSIFLIIVNKVYAIFGHGVSSGYMTWMFLYTLLGGSVFYLLIGLLQPELVKYSGYRAFYNLYNSGIALMTVGSFMKGVFEIAGTDSPFVAYYFMIGFLFITAGFVIIVRSFFKNVRVKEAVK